MTNLRMIATAVVACAASATLLPGTASAATVTRAADGALHYTAAAARTNSVHVQAGVDPGSIVFYTSGDAMDAFPADCTPSDLYGGDVVACPAASAVHVDLGDGDDRGVTSNDVTVPVTLAGGPGADLLDDSERGNALDGGAGDDRIIGGEGADVLSGGDGADDIEGKGGPDRIDGGAGDDLLHPDGYEAPAADVVDGGPGIDAIDSDYSSRFSSATPPVAITLAGGADDGRDGEGDDLRGIERVTVNVAGRYVGTDGADEFKVRQVLDPVELTGGAGDDRLSAADGPDKLDGGPGADYLDGGFGHDAIVAGPGRDTIFGDIPGGDCGPVWCKLPYGDDTIDAVDGEVDNVTCGAGQDAVKADTVDVVAPDCEQVTRTGGSPVVGGFGGGGADAGAGAGGGAAQKIALAGRTRLRSALSRGFTVRVTGAPRGTVKLLARRGRTVVARGTGRASVGGTALVRLRFTAAARRSLRRAAKVTLNVSGGGVSVKVTLRR